MINQPPIGARIDGHQGFSEGKACGEKIVHRDHYIQVRQHGDAMHGHFSHSFSEVNA